MSLQFSTYLRNIRLEAIEAVLGPSPVLRIWTGAVPASCAAPNFGTLLVEMNLPADWMANAVNGTKSKSGTWEDLYANNTGVAGHFRIYDGAGTCHLQGTCGASATTADMVISPVALSAGNYIKVTSFQITERNA